jgi:hypothetical protein
MPIRSCQVPPSDDQEPAEHRAEHRGNASGAPEIARPPPDDGAKNAPAVEREGGGEIEEGEHRVRQRKKGENAG